MPYTVKQLAELSGVSIRTLRFYDEVDLLKPAYCGENKYRYYEKEQLLCLQQILFFRQLDFKLADIKEILEGDLDLVPLLVTQRQRLIEKIEKHQQLLLTIDKTIADLAGKAPIKDEEIYSGFHVVDLPAYDEIAIKEIGDIAETLITRRNQRLSGWSNEQWAEVIYKRNQLLARAKEYLEFSIKPESSCMQTLMDEWYILTVKPMYDPNRQEFMTLMALNCSQPDYRKSLDFYHPYLAEYVKIAAEYFADNSARFGKI